MVLELHVPLFDGKQDLNDDAVWQTLGNMALVFFAYFTSFALVALWWTVHMRVTRSLKAFDWPTAIWNLVFILTVTLIPFASSVMGNMNSSAAAWEIYWGVNAAASLALTGLMLTISRGGGKLIGGMGGRERLSRVMQSIGPAIAFAVGIWLAIRGEIRLSRWCWVIIPVLGFMTRFIYHAPKPVAVETPDDA